MPVIPASAAGSAAAAFGRTIERPDAVVIGAGPNGLVAANVLGDAGWKVLVLEANDAPGGAVRTAEVTAPGFRNDLFSAFYPMTAASPVIDELSLQQFGLEWTHAPKVLAHPRPDGPAAVLSRDVDLTAASLERGAPADGDRYRRLYEQWRQVSTPLMGSLLRPFPPVRDALRLVRAAGLDGTAELARLALLSVRRLIEENFSGEAAALLFAGNALHADLTPDTSGSALFGWMLVGLGQELGFPVPVGGADAITAALVRRAVSRGVDIQCEQLVTRIDLSNGRVAGVTTADGTHIGTRVVLADCDFTTLMTQMVGVDALPSRFLRDLERFQRSSSTFKIDWALSGPAPWSDTDVAGAGTVHIADSLDELTLTSANLAMRRIPDEPFLLVGQMTTSDPSRSPPGTESMWAYTHVPQHAVVDAGSDGITGAWTASDVEAFAARMEGRIEAHAPGFTSRILARHVMSPRDLEEANPNLVGGDISGGTAQLHQQLVFRPLGGRARPETPIPDLFLASASAHPGGAVHGACGANAARAALAHHPIRRFRNHLTQAIAPPTAGSSWAR
jgi:phytoene dehydrogenase-like protein